LKVSIEKQQGIENAGRSPAGGLLSEMSLCVRKWKALSWGQTLAMLGSLADLLGLAFIRTKPQ
jgi:hypothetical protein